MFKWRDMFKNAESREKESRQAIPFGTLDKAFKLNSMQTPNFEPSAFFDSSLINPIGAQTESKPPFRPDVDAETALGLDAPKLHLCFSEILTQFQDIYETGFLPNKEEINLDQQKVIKKLLTIMYVRMEQHGVDKYFA